MPIVIDRGAVLRVPAGKNVKTIFNHEAFRGVQERFYAPLHRALAPCWPEGAPLPTCGMTDFLAVCAAEIAKKEQGEPALLSSEWARNKPREISCDANIAKSQKAVAAADAYERRLAPG